MAVANPGSADFAVINFSNTPPTVSMTTGFEKGNVVDCYGTLAAVGESLGLGVALFDLSTPASPVKIGSVSTIGLIGSISMDGSYVLTGEFEGSRVSLIDISDPENPQLVGVSDCAPWLNTISSVALRYPIAVVSGDNQSVFFDFHGIQPTTAEPNPLLHNAWPSDFDGETAALANAQGGIQTYTVSGIDATPLTLVPFPQGTDSVAVAEIPDGGQFIAAGGTGSFTVYAYPTNLPMGSIETSLHTKSPSSGTVVKFLNNPAVAPVLAVANLTASGVFVSTYLIQVQTGLPNGTIVSFLTPIWVAEVTLEQELSPTLGITAFTPKRRPPPHGR